MCYHANIGSMVTTVREWQCQNRLKSNRVNKLSDDCKGNIITLSNELLLTNELKGA